MRGWNDPVGAFVNVHVLFALRRADLAAETLHPHRHKTQGRSSGAILEFVNELGVSTTNSVIEIKRFEQTIRGYLERTVPRLMLVLDPVPVVIEDVAELDGKPLTIPFNPKDPGMGSHEIKFSKTVYVDRSDFREEPDPSFFRLAPGR